MNIQIHSGNINGEQIQTVNARDLHAFLEVRSRFNDWFASRVKDYGFVENLDFVAFTEKSVKPHSGGRPSREYHISLDMAKELSMVERTPKGKEARQYFIKMERKARLNSNAEHRRQMLRQDGKAIRKDFTNSLRDHGCEKPHHFMNCSKVVAKAATGMTPKQIRETRGVKNARDGMTSVELMSVGLMEALAEQNMDDASSDGFAECYHETKRATHSVAIALNANATSPRLEASK